MSLNGFAKALRGLAWKRRSLYSDESAAERLGWSVGKLLDVESGKGDVWEMDAVLRLVGSELGRMGGVKRVRAKGEWSAMEVARLLSLGDAPRCEVCGRRKGTVRGCGCLAGSQR